jgi:ADP-ribosylglycohydrolase
VTRRHPHVSALTPLDRIRSALLGGAVGDALGTHAEASHPTAITAQATPAGRQDTVDAGHGTVTAVNRHGNETRPKFG